MYPEDAFSGYPARVVVLARQFYDVLAFLKPTFAVTAVTHVTAHGHGRANRSAGSSAERGMRFAPHHDVT